jgi:hypothetical protein
MVAQLLNQFSFLLFIAIPLLLLLVYTFSRENGSRLLQIGSVSVLGLVVIGYFLLRPGTHQVSGPDIESLLAGGDRPVLLEVYSNY